MKDRLIAADRVQQKKSAWFQTAMDSLKISSVVLPSNVFKHSERADDIELSGHVSVVLQTQIDR
jgi:hypothetical protein